MLDPLTIVLLVLIIVTVPTILILVSRIILKKYASKMHFSKSKTVVLPTKISEKPL